MLDSVIQSFQNYYDDLPSNTFYCVGRSAVFSFTVSIIWAKGSGGLPGILESSLKDLHRPLYAAVFAGLASLIHTLTQPLFNKIFGDNNQNKMHREFIKAPINLLLSRVCVLSMPAFAEEATKSIVVIAANVFFSIPQTCLDILQLIPSIPPQELADIQNFINDWGLNTPPDSGGTYLTFA